MTLLWLCLFALGFFCLWKGGHWLIDSACHIATKYQIPEFVIGLILVSFGTSLPELCVNIIATLSNQPDIVFGNIIGSNISNILLIFGFTAIFSPIIFQSNMLYKELVLSIGAALTLLSVHIVTLGTPLTHWHGGLFLAFFCGFLYWTHKSHQDSPPIQDHNNPTPAPLVLTLYFVAGLLSLLIGGKLVVFSAQKIALAFNVSNTLIALFLVALGTSLPELAATFISIKKGRHSLAIGNVLGSNIFNIWFVLGTCLAIKPLQINPILGLDITIMIGAGIILGLLLCLPKFFHLTRWKGVSILLMYGLYIMMIYIRG